jgi:hypothetical protein
MTRGVWVGMSTAYAGSWGAANPMTAIGDMIVGGASGIPTSLAAGTVNYVLTSNGAGVAPSWKVSSSGFTNPMTTIGDLIVGGTSGAAGRLAAGTATYVLTSNGAGVAPTWQVAPGGVGSVAWGSVTGTLSSQTDLQAALDLKQARTPNVQSVTSATSVVPTFSNDAVKITAQAAALTLSNPTGTAIDMLGIAIRVKDNGTAWAITYGTQYRAIGVTLPTTTVVGKTLYLGCIWNAADTKLDVVAVAQEA